MAEFPALQLWTDAYLGDTRHLSTLEHGAYLLLLMTAWRTRTTSLPDDDKLLARYAGLTLTQWLRIKPTIAAFFRIEDGVWRQSRLTDEAKAVRQRRESASRAGNASALKRKERHSTDVELPLQRNSTLPQPQPQPQPIEEESHSPGATVEDGRSIEIETLPLSQEDLLTITNRLARVGGVNVNPSRPGPFVRELDIVKGWLGDRIDVDATIVPAIAKRLAATAEDHVSSLRFYDRDVRKAHALTLNGAGTPVAEAWSPERRAEYDDRRKRLGLE